MKIFKSTKNGTVMNSQDWYEEMASELYGSEFYSLAPNQKMDIYQKFILRKNNGVYKEVVEV